MVWWSLVPNKKTVKKEVKRDTRGEKKEVRKIARKEADTVVEKLLQEVLPSDELASLAASAVGLGLDYGIGMIPMVGDIATMAGRATGLWKPAPANNPFHPAFKAGLASRSPALVRKADLQRKEGPGPHQVDVKRSLYNQLRLAATLKGHSAMVKSGFRNSMPSETVPFVSGGLQGLPQYHEVFPLMESNGEQFHLITGRQYLSRLPTSAAAGEMLMSIELDPSDQSLGGTRLATLAGLYNKLKWLNVGLIYQQNASAALGGGLVLASWLDPADSLAKYPEGDARINAALTMDGNVVPTSIWQSCAHFGNENQRPLFQDMTNSSPDESQLRLTSAGVYEAMCTGSYDNSGSSPGMFYLEYNIIGINDVASTVSTGGRSNFSATDAMLYGSSAQVPLGDAVVNIGDLYATTAYLTAVPWRGQVVKGDKLFSFDCAGSPDNGDSNGDTEWSRFGSLAALGGRWGTGSSPTDARYHLPYGVWDIVVEEGHMLFAPGGISIEAPASMNEPAQVTTTFAGSTWVYGASTGRFIRRAYRVVSSAGHSQIRIKRTAPPVPGVTGANLVHMAMHICRSTESASSFRRFSSSVIKMLEQDPTALAELGPQVWDAGESSYLSPAKTAVTEELVRRGLISRENLAAHLGK